jgi:hypothetical protein
MAVPLTVKPTTLNIFISFSLAYPPYDPKEARMVRCPKYNLAKLGCHNARDPSKPYLPRAVPELMLTTDSSNYKYVGYKRSAFPTYQDFLSRYNIAHL